MKNSDQSKKKKSTRELDDEYSAALALAHAAVAKVANARAKAAEAEARVAEALDEAERATDEAIRIGEALQARIRSEKAVPPPRNLNFDGHECCSHGRTRE